MPLTTSTTTKPPVPLFFPALHAPAPAAMQPQPLTLAVVEETASIETMLPRIFLTREQCVNKVRQQNLARVVTELEEAKEPVWLDFSESETRAGEIKDEIFGKLSPAGQEKVERLNLGDAMISGMSLKDFTNLKVLDASKVRVASSKDLSRLLETVPQSTMVLITATQKSFSEEKARTISM